MAGQPARHLGAPRRPCVRCSSPCPGPLSTAFVGGDELLVAALGAGAALAASRVVGPLASLAPSLVGDRLSAYVGEQILHAVGRDCSSGTAQERLTRTGPTALA